MATSANQYTDRHIALKTMVIVFVEAHGRLVDADGGQTMMKRVFLYVRV
jgi:hypothetical protein